MRICVVIPTYNEIENIDDVISKVMLHDGYHVLIVDDSSPDGTAQRVNEIKELYPGRVSLLVRETKDGLGGAYLHGFKHAISQGYEILCEMDADLSHDPAALPSLIQPVLNGEADLAIGSRYVPGGKIPAWSFHRKLLSRGGNMYTRFMLGVDVNDATGGFRAYRAGLLSQIMTQEVKADGYGFQIEMTYVSSQCKAKIVEIPISFSDRIRGTSKMSFSIVIEALWLVTFWSLRDKIFKRKQARLRRERYLEVDITSDESTPSDSIDTSSRK